MIKDDAKFGFVYQIKCLKNNKIYIGGTTNFVSRVSCHLSALKYNKHANKNLQKDYNKFGSKYFIITVLEEVLNNFVVKVEQKWIDKLKSKTELYNISLVASLEGNKIRKGKKMPKEAKDNISKSLIGNQRRKGIKHEEISKQKISKSLKEAYKERKHKPPNIKICTNNIMKYNKERQTKCQ